MGVVCKEEHLGLSIVVFVYSMVSLFAFMNLTYVRDFDALQINFTPMALSIISTIHLMRASDFTLIGMTISLLADSYFALRFKDNSDKINYTPIENFARESWTQQAFQGDNLTL